MKNRRVTVRQKQPRHRKDAPVSNIFLDSGKIIIYATRIVAFNAGSINLDMAVLGIQKS